MMPTRENGCYCFTLETIDTVDIFTKPMYKQVIVHSLNHFIDSKGLIVYGWCLMSNKLYLICQSAGSIDPKTLIDDLAVFTCSKLTEAIKSEGCARGAWLLQHFKRPASYFDESASNSCWDKVLLVTQVDMNAPQDLAEELELIHACPVKDRVVQFSSDYIYSSARDYSGLPGLIKVTRPLQVEQALYEIEKRKGGFRHNYSS